MNRSETFQFYSKKCINSRENIYYCLLSLVVLVVVIIPLFLFLCLCLSSIACLLFSHCVVVFAPNHRFPYDCLFFLSSPKHFNCYCCYSNSIQSTIYHYGNLFRADIILRILFELLLSPSSPRSVRFDPVHSNNNYSKKRKWKKFRRMAKNWEQKGKNRPTD